jgi:hypothetical protein
MKDLGLPSSITLADGTVLATRNGCPLPPWIIGEAMQRAVQDFQQKSGADVTPVPGQNVGAQTAEALQPALLAHAWPRFAPLPPGPVYADDGTILRDGKVIGRWKP